MVASENVMASYLTRLMTLDNLTKTISRLTEALKPHANQFDTIAFRGVSGTMIGPILAMNLQKEMLVVRKLPHESHASHSWRLVEGNGECQKYIIVDDIVASGATLFNICDEIRNVGNWVYGPPKCVGLATFLQGFIPLKPEYDSEDWDDIYTDWGKFYKASLNKDAFWVDVKNQL